MVSADLLANPFLFAFLVGSTIDDGGVQRGFVPKEIAIFLDGIDGKAEAFHRLI